MMSSLPRILVLVLAFFLLAGLACLNAELPEKPAIRSAVLEQFKLSRDSKCLLLPVGIKGRRYSFMIDTGATLTCYDKSLRSFLGDPVRTGTMQILDGHEEFPLFRPPAAKVGGLDLPTKSLVLCDDFHGWHARLKQEIHGALGMDFLKGLIFRIDFLHAEVTFLRSVDAVAGTRIPIFFKDEVPHVEVTLPGLKQREEFVVATGYVGISGGCLRAEVFDALVKRDFLVPADDSILITASGSSSTKRGRLESISLGKFCHKKLLFSRVKSNVLSLNYFSQYEEVTFDFSNGAIYLKGERLAKGKDEEIGKKKGETIKKKRGQEKG